MKSATAIFVSIFLFKISLIIFAFKLLGETLTELITYFGIFLGIVLLAVGIKEHIKAKKLSLKEQRIKNMEPFSPILLLDPFFSLAEATKRIYKNPRRSMAMLSGIILGTLIISSVFIYANVLEKETYEAMVGGIPYEASFSLNEPGNESELWSYANRIKNDHRIESVTVFSGGSPMGNGVYGEGGVIAYDDDDAALQLTVKIADDTQVQSIESGGPGGYRTKGVINPVFIRENFTGTTIYDKVVGDRLEGKFDMFSGGNRTVIPRTAALRLNLNVGNVISWINITFFSYKTSQSVVVRFERVTVVGIYEAYRAEASMEDEDETSEVIYFDSGMLAQDSQLREVFRDNRLFTLAVKIDKGEFNTGDLQKMNTQIDRLINDITKDTDDDLKGSNNVEMILGMSAFLNIILTVIDVILIVPILVLTMYLLIYGLELSLEERKKEIGILKVQGANTRQIFGQVMSESFLLFAFGLALGYVLAILGAWVISSSVGFMTFNFSFSYLKDFLFFDTLAFLVSFFIIGIIVYVSIHKRGRKFIDLQVSEAVQMMQWKKVGFMRRHRIDLILFSFGFISALRTILAEVFGITRILGIKLSISYGWDIFLFGVVGTIALWIGGAFSAPVMAKWTALKLEKVILKFKMFQDIGPIIKSGLKRRGDVVKLVFIIALTLAIASLAVVQGYSDERFTVREMEYTIGADYQVRFSNSSDHRGVLLSVDGVKEAMSLPSLTVEVLSDSFEIFGIDVENASFAKWHQDSFVDESSSSALDKLPRTNSPPGVYIGSSAASTIGAEKGDIITLKVKKFDPLSVNVSTRTFDEIIKKFDVKVLGKFDHVPGGINSEAILADHTTILKLRALWNYHYINTSGTVTVRNDAIDPILTDNSLDVGIMRSSFEFNISVASSINAVSATVNWTHGSLNKNTSLILRNGYWMGKVGLDVSLNDLRYTFFLKDNFSNTNISQVQRVKIENPPHPFHIIDFSRTTAVPGGVYEFNISLGEMIPVDSVLVQWEHDSFSGELTLVKTDGFYIGSIPLVNSTTPLMYTIKVMDPSVDTGSTKYLVSASSGASRSELSEELNLLEGVTGVTDLEHEIENIGNLNNWGIPGLLTMMFIAALIAALTISFTFSSIIMKKRMREFAVLQTIGATRGQVYKIAISENAVLMMVSVVWGIGIGLGLSYLMNGFFEFIGQMLERGVLERLVFVPWLQLGWIALASFIGMLLAVALSAISAARQDLSVSTRVI